MRLTPFYIAFIYFVCSAFWILFSDNLLHELQQQQGINDIIPLSIAKGLVFITATALLIFFLSDYHEKKLRSSLENYQKLFEGSPFPIYIVDLDTLNFVAVNDACTRQYGYTRDEFLALNLRDIRPHEDIPILERAINKNTTGFVDAGHWRHIKKSGELLHIHVTYQHVTFNKRACILVLPQEISTQLKAEQKVGELVKELSEFKNAISSSALLIIANHEGKIEFMNSNLEKLSQHSYAAKIGKLFTEVATGLRDNGFNTQMWQCMSKGEVWKGELYNSKKEGT
ncbi:MAG TPA: PAS domain S-box protein, partial [Bacteroidia bacterium]|nr:PAS domain S-box protein [Bacteroidia bacterium]